jgi:mannose-6-phosphate isomerase
VSRLEPFALSPVLVERPWGGSRLVAFGKHLSPGASVGESWELCDLPTEVAPHVVDPRSRVAGGPLAGLALRELIERFGPRLLGSVSPTPERNFPLLVKLLDAEENLSVQVHPHADYVARHPDARLKTESWYVVAADEGAELFLDFRSGVTLDQIDDALGTPEVVPLLQRVPAEPGAFHHLPAGLVHALGAGVIVAEVQTPSDTTFRLYDWGEEYGRAPRPLHLAECRETLVIDPPGATSVAPAEGSGSRLLESNNHYWIREHRTGNTLDLDPAAEVRILMVIAGEIEVDGRSFPVGTTVIVPAEAVAGVAVEAVENAIVLEVGLGSG